MPDSSEPFRGHAIRRLTDVLETLATGTGDVRARLLAASFGFPGIKREDFPEDMRKTWDEVLETVGRFEPFFEAAGGMFQNSTKNATRGMKNSTAQRAARDLWKLYWSVSKNRRYE